MDGELKLYPSASRNTWAVASGILIGLIFPLTTVFYFLFISLHIDIFVGLLLLASLVIGVQMLLRIAISIANLINKNPRIVFTSSEVVFNFPFVKSFSIPISEIEVIYQFIGYQQIGYIFSERASLVFILKNKNYSSHTRKMKLLDYFSNLASPTGSSLVSKKPENDYLVVSNIYYSGPTVEVFKKLNAQGFTKTDPSFPA